MPATVRYDEQYCPIARALDVLGDRWTLLILRELMIGDQRFTDLREHLPGIAPTLLTQRLRTLAEQGLVATAAGTGKRPIYTITEQGRQAAPVMRALSRFGLPLLGPAEEAEVVRPWSAVHACVTPFFDPEAAHGIDERYLFRIDGEEHLVSTVRGGGPARPPDLVLESGAAVWFDIRQGRATLPGAIRAGQVKVRGPKSALANLRAVFRLG